MKDVFDEWLARVICFAFSIPPSALISQVNRATAETAQDTALSEGLAPLQSWVKQLVDQVIASEFQSPDLEFAWDEDRAVDPSDVARIAASYVAAGIKSVNEVRAELGLAPVPGGDLPPGPQAPGGNDAAASGTPSSDKLLRFNPNHYGPGERGGQFAPKDEGGGSSPIVPAQLNPRNAITVMNAVRRWLQTMPKRPNLPSRPPAETPPPEGEPQSGPPAENAPTSPPTDEYSLPKDKPPGRSQSYNAGTDAASRLKEALQNDWHTVVERAGQVVDATHWVADQVSNIVADVDFSQAAPYDLDDLVAAAKKKSEPGYQDHHIVEQGPQNDDLSPEEKKRIDHPENIVRIPYYVHQQITNYYRSPDPKLPGKVTPRQYLRGKSFDERYQFGLNVLRDKFGVLK